MNRAVFVDRDGTLNEMVYDETHGLFDSPRRPEDVRLRPHAADFLRTMKKCGYLVVVVTNQPGIAKGTLSLRALTAINERLGTLLAAKDAAWDALRFCPHFPGTVPKKNKYNIACDCRKPKPGLLRTAARELAIDLGKSWMVGDGLNDVQAGNRAGAKSILIAKLKIEQVERFFNLENCRPDAIANDLKQAAEIINRKTKRPFSVILNEVKNLRHINSADRDSSPRSE